MYTFQRVQDNVLIYVLMQHLLWSYIRLSVQQPPRHTLEDHRGSGLGILLNCQQDSTLQ